MAEKPSNKGKIQHDSEIRARMRRQNGYATRQQILEIGLTAKAIDGRLKSGRYVAVYNGVYSEGPPREDPVGRASAAVLACGPHACLSHGSAVSLWRFRDRWEPPWEVIARSHRCRPGVTVHRCRTLARQDVTRHFGIPVTSPARTVLDVAPRLSAKALRGLVNDARLSRHLRLRALQDLLDRNPYHRGTRLLRPFHEDAVNPTRSPFEDEFRAFIEAFGLPMPQINVPVNGHEVDAFFPEHNLVVELDGWEFHRDRTAFAEDRDRDADHLRAGYPTVRITKDRIKGSPEREAARLHAILEQELRRRRPG